MQKNSLGQDCPYAIEATRDGFTRRFRWLPTLELAVNQAASMKRSFPLNDYRVVDERTEE